MDVERTRSSTYTLLHRMGGGPTDRASGHTLVPANMRHITAIASWGWWAQRSHHDMCIHKVPCIQHTRKYMSIQPTDRVTYPISYSIARVYIRVLYAFTQSHYLYYVGAKSSHIFHRQCDSYYRNVFKRIQCTMNDATMKPSWLRLEVAMRPR